MLTPIAARRHSRGFSLIEAMVVVVIMATLAALALPDFSRMITNYRVRTTADAIMSGLQLARTEAIRLNTGVTFTLASSGGWSVAVPSPAQTLQTRPAGESGGKMQIASLNDQLSLTFTSTGRVFNFSPTTNLSHLTVTAAGKSIDTLQIDVYAGGQSRLCNPSITTANDPRSC